MHTTKSLRYWGYMKKYQVQMRAQASRGNVQVENRNTGGLTSQHKGRTTWNLNIQVGYNWFQMQDLTSAVRILHSRLLGHVLFGIHATSNTVATTLISTWSATVIDVPNTQDFGACQKMPTLEMNMFVDLFFLVTSHTNLSWVFE